MKKLLYITITLLTGSLCSFANTGIDTIQWSVATTFAGATGEFAPYLIGSNSGGRHAMSGTTIVEISGTKDFNLTKRFSWTAGVEADAGWQASANYALYDESSEKWLSRPWHPSRMWLQQAWAGVKWRGAMLWAGMKEHRSPIVDDALSSGDLTLSNNARPIPQIQAGFVNYQNIPLTKGWVQINGVIAYGKYTDSDALRNRFNYYTLYICPGQYFTYKRAHFRTRPDRPLSVTIGAQAAGEFGGTTYRYSDGRLNIVHDNPHSLKTFWQMFIPSLGNGDGFVEGNHLGTWDFKARYRLHSGIELEGYFQWLWEDGSSMARRNNTDGLWGFAIRFPGSRPAVRTILAEYIDFRDQSGPIHWAPGDAPGTTITSEATGGDNYYNSTTFNAWANYGLGLGSSFPLAPLYNTDGYPQFLHNRTRGIHIAAKGCLGQEFDWTAKFSHGVAWGAGRTPDARALKNTSAMIAADYDASCLLTGLRAGAALAFDAGKLRGNNFGALVKISYNGNINFGK